jgi:acyl transferase domain-containing protein/acyl carrier protein
VRGLVHGLVAEVLGHDDVAAVNPDTSFADLGFDSLTVVDLRDRLAAATGLTLRATLVFDHPTVTGLAEQLVRDMTGGAVARTPAAGPAADRSDQPIAIVAMACRFPGGIDSPEALWQAVLDEADVTSPFPADRGWSRDELYDPDPDAPRSTYVDRGGFVRDAGHFDAEFFGISAREATAMDPQQRLVLETSWEAFERAAVAPGSLRGSRTGVYLGITDQGYTGRVRDAGSAMEGYLATGGQPSVMSGRVAYLLGLHGPAVSIDTACSSSLVALHTAAQALRAGDCDLALAGGVMVMAEPTGFLAFSRQRGLARDGRCKSYAAAADGFALAEGVGMLVVERLADAERRGHPVLAVLRGSAVNSDGASNGLTAPNGLAQQQVIRSALGAAGLRAADVDLLEGHGTGTTLGDPIEAEAVLATYGQDRDAGRPLWLGSVKSNLGHTQAAAGMAGVIKAVTAMRAGVLPRTLHVDAPSPHVAWNDDVRLLTGARPWSVDGRPRRAAVSAFGISGTNAHVVLEEPALAPPAVPPDTDGPVPVVVSGHTDAALREQAGRLARHLDQERPRLADLALSALTTRTVLRRSAVLVAGDADELRERLAAVAAGPDRPGEGGLAFVFTGQGAQRAGMGAALHRSFPVFAEAFDGICAHFEPLLGRPLGDVITGDEDLLNRTEYTQPALFAYEVALAALLASWGIRPAQVAGHSIGELAAAHVAGLWSAADACAVVAARGRLMGALPADGAMIAIAAPEEAVRAALDGVPGLTERVGIAAVNGPAAVVISGAAAETVALADTFATQGVRVRRLTVSHPFHSPAMEPMLGELGAVLERVSFTEPAIPVVSGLTGRPAGPELLTPDYWVRHARETVRFADAVTGLAAGGAGTLLEVGPDAILTGMVAEQPVAAGIATARRDRDEVRTLLTALGRLHIRGVAVDWPRFFAPHGAVRVDLPTYAFQRERYWLDAPGTAGPRGALYRVAWEPHPGAVPASLDGATVLGTLPLAPELPAVADVAAAGTAAPALLLVPVTAAATRETVHTVLGTLRELLGDDRLGGTRLALLTTRAVGTGDNDDTDPAQTAALGAILSAQAEYPGRMVTVDLGPDATAAGLGAALAVAADGEAQVAVRGSTVLRPRLTESEPAAGGDADTAPLDPTGTVLVTGSTGAIGGIVARHLAARYGVRHLLLLSRTGAAAGTAAELGRELAALGAQAEFVACDVADRDALAGVLAAIPTDRPLRAVVHVAGTTADGTVTGLTGERIDAVLPAKVDAADVLRELTTGATLDRVLLFSSAVGALGGAGQANYAAANAYLDGLAREWRAAGVPVTALAWGPWQAATGMAGRLTDGHRRRLTGSGVKAFTEAAALALLDRAWRSDEPVLVPLLPDPDALAARAAAGDLPAVLRDLVAATARAAAPPPQQPSFATLGDADRRRELLALVRGRTAGILDHRDPARLEPASRFADLGFDSLTAVELRNALAAATGTTLPSGLIFDHPTIGALVAYLDGAVLAAAGPARLPVSTQLDRLESALADLAPDAPDRAVARARLRAMVDAWDRAAQPAPVAGDDVAMRLDVASDDAIFDFINTELGRK